MLFGYTDRSQDPRVHAQDAPASKSYEYLMSGFRKTLKMRSATSYPWRAHLKSRGYAFDDYSDLLALENDVRSVMVKAPKTQVPNCR